MNASTDGYSSTAVRRLEETAEGTRLLAEFEYRFELRWPQKALVPVMEFRSRRAMRKQLCAVLDVVKAQVEAGQVRAT